MRGQTSASQDDGLVREFLHDFRSLPPRYDFRYGWGQAEPQCPFLFRIAQGRDTYDDDAQSVI